MRFNTSKVSFGRNESFPLRFGWLTKGYQAITEDPFLFSNEDAPVQLGVGKNMVHSIRYWLLATEMAEVRTDGGLRPSKLGKKIFAAKNGWDPYLEDEATIWLMHWKLATNPNLATAIYWFFNEFHKPEFTSAEQATALRDFAAERIKSKVSLGTLKRDAALVLRMYTLGVVSNKTPLEESLDSPLALLRLLNYSKSGKRYQARAEQARDIPSAVLYFACGEVLDELDQDQIPIKDLMYGREGRVAPGSVFRLTESGLLASLERMIADFPKDFEIRETAGIHQLYRIGAFTGIEVLQQHYQRFQGVKAA